MDIEKAFYILDHNFLILVLKQFRFGQNFIDWIKTFVKDEKSCIINGGKTTPYFSLHRGVRQDDLISAILLSCLWKFCSFRKKIQRSKELKYLILVIYILHTPITLHFSSNLKRNISKYEIVPMAACGMKSIDLTTDLIKIHSTCFSCHQKIREEANVLRTQSLLKLWKMRNLIFRR